MRLNQIKLICDYCDYSDIINVDGNPLELLPKLKKWYGVVKADAEAKQTDNHNWYDSLDCMVAGEKKIHAGS